MINDIGIGKQPTGSLDRVIEALIQERVFNAANQGESPECNKREEELISISRDIKDKIGLKHFMRYEELSSLNENESLRDTYKQGFMDCVSLVREILFK